MLNASSHRKAMDPPAVNRAHDDAVPSDIKSMVSKLENYIDKHNEEKTATGPTRSNTPLQTRSGRPGSTHNRSSSREPRRATDLSRSRSMSKVDDRNGAGSGRDRSRSINRSSHTPGSPRGRSRSRSINRSGHASRSPLGRNTTTTNSESQNHALPSRSGSRRQLDRSGHGQERRPRSRSIQRSDPDSSDGKPRARSRSIRRSEDDDYARGPRPRSRSIQRNNDQDYPSRPRSLSRPRSENSQKTPGTSTPSGTNLSRSNHGGQPSMASNTGAASGPSSKPTTPIAGTPSKPSGASNTEGAKPVRIGIRQEDGSVLVIQKRTREDGAIVTTKTKYANVALARNHGVQVE